MTTSWPRIQKQVEQIKTLIEELPTSGYAELKI